MRVFSGFREVSCILFSFYVGQSWLPHHVQPVLDPQSNTL